MQKSPAVCLTLALCTWLAASGLVAAAPGRSDGIISGVGIERGVTRILCSRPDTERRRRSRAIILDTGEQGLLHDVLLAPAHVLPADVELARDQCFIVGAHGATAEIAELWLPGDRGAGDAGDWAVLLTNEVLQGSVGRLQVEALRRNSLTTLVKDETPVRLVLFSEQSEQPGCRMIDDGSRAAGELETGVFLHSCRVWPGVSGAPIVFNEDGKSIVIGMNIAHRFRVSNQGPARSMGVARAIDDEIASAIREATERALEPPLVTERVNENRKRRRHK